MRQLLTLARPLLKSRLECPTYLYADGWDIYRSDHVEIKHSYINNDDDCVGEFTMQTSSTFQPDRLLAFKPNSTNIRVSHLWCNGSHGISVGSLGQVRACAARCIGMLTRSLQVRWRS